VAETRLRVIGIALEPTMTPKRTDPLSVPSDLRKDKKVQKNLDHFASLVGI